MNSPTASEPLPDPGRRILLLAHTGRDEAVAVARKVADALLGHGIAVRLLADEARDLGLAATEGEARVEIVDPEQDLDDAADGCELAVVIGGDGTILRAAEVTHAHGTPLLGVNLGHVGFLAEAERDDVEHTIEAVVSRAYRIEDRLTVDIDVYEPGPDGSGEHVMSCWALNEASVEKASRQRMLEVVLEIDGRPLSRWGCDGVVCATPTGSTAYNFSAGGPIVWPEVEALLIVPISAHALFARPMVVAPTSLLAMEVLPESGTPGVLWCDGRRTVDLPVGSRVEVRRGARPVRLARLHEAPFSDRLVAKFGLSVEGWRGSKPDSSLGAPAS